MEILDNPFHILRATLRDSRQRIVERTEERSIIDDPDRCENARAILTHPRKRLAAELGWLPGLSPKRIAAAIQVLKSDITKITIFDSLPPLARANLYAAALPKVAGRLDRSTLLGWIIGLAEASEEIDGSSVMRLINEERAVAGFPTVSDETVIDAELTELWKRYGDAVKNALDQCPTSELIEIVTTVVDQATGYGTKHGPSLVDDVVDRYELETHRFLDAESKNIHKVLEFLTRKVSDGADKSTLEMGVDQLERVMKNWDRVAQPIQVNRMSRGQEHEMSRELAIAVRNVAVEIYNQQGELEVSQRITALVQEVFAEVLSAAEQAADDLAQLSELEEDARQAESNSEEWRREIEYEAKWGTVFRQRLRISVDGIEWNDRAWKLEEISRIRWGATKRYINGIPSGTEYMVAFATRHDSQVVHPKSEEVFREFTSRLFRAVGVRLIMEMLAGLKRGEKYRFGNAVLDDLGMELETKRFFGANERHHHTWDRLEISSAGGLFKIGRTGDKKTSVELSYQDTDNAHVLESAIRMLWSKGGQRLSSVI